MLAVVTAAVVMLAGCSRTADETGTLRSRVQAWARSTGATQSTAALQADSSRIRHDQRAASAGVVQFDCVTLGQDTTRANSALVTPDQQLTAYFGAAYNDYYSYAQACVDGKGQAGALARLSHVLVSGDQELSLAQARLAQLEG